MTDDRLLLPDGVRATLHERREAGAPAEVCGVLLGERGGDDPPADRVAEAVAVDNVAGDARRRYELDPAATLAAIDDAGTRGLEPVGFYHSHPRGPAEPSATDRERATWTGHVHAIVAPGELGAYRWTGDSFRSLRVETP